jgi:hypothetical protein
LELLRHSCAGRHQHQPRVPDSTLPTSPREDQEAHARCQSTTTYSATIAVTLNIDRPLYIARIQALSHPRPHSCLSFPPTTSISDRAALLPLSFPHPSRLVSTFTSLLKSPTPQHLSPPFAPCPVRQFDYVFLSSAARILSSHCALSVVCSTARGPPQRNSARSGSAPTSSPTYKMGACGSTESGGEDMEQKKRSQAIDKKLEEDSRRLRKECKILLLGSSWPVFVRSRHPNLLRRLRRKW